jgi:hypothetical protein
MSLVKIGWKSVFIYHEAHILAWLHGSVLYIILGVLNTIKFCLKIQMERIQFCQKRLFATKIEQKSVFLSHEAHIPAQLDVTMLYINF